MRNPLTYLYRGLHLMLAFRFLQCSGSVESVVLEINLRKYSIKMYFLQKSVLFLVAVVVVNGASIENVQPSVSVSVSSSSSVSSETKDDQKLVHNIPIVNIEKSARALHFDDGAKVDISLPYSIISLNTIPNEERARILKVEVESATAAKNESSENITTENIPVETTSTVAESTETTTAFRKLAKTTIAFKELTETTIAPKEITETTASFQDQEVSASTSTPTSTSTEQYETSNKYDEAVTTEGPELTQEAQLAEIVIKVNTTSTNKPEYHK